MLTDYTDELRMIAEMPHPHVQVRTIFVHTNIPQKLLNDALSLTFNVEDSVRDWAAHLTHASYAQVMTIHPGPQGQAFIPSQLSKIGEIRKINPLCKICIDGSVNEQTITSIRNTISSCVPDECGVGSYFSRATSDELPTRLRALQSKH
jgi:pentose-5-phosphate-3-epimerase